MSCQHPQRPSRSLRKWNTTCGKTTDRPGALPTGFAHTEGYVQCTICGCFTDRPGALPTGFGGGGPQVLMHVDKHAHPWWRWLRIFRAAAAAVPGPGPRAGVGEEGGGEVVSGLFLG